jgi:hypothetical protein
VIRLPNVLAIALWLTLPAKAPPNSALIPPVMQIEPAAGGSSAYGSCGVTAPPCSSIFARLGGLPATCRDCFSRSEENLSDNWLEKKQGHRNCFRSVFSRREKMKTNLWGCLEA